MAKGGRTFADKARKHAERKAEDQHVRVIRSIKNPNTGAVKFSDLVVTVPHDADQDKYLSEVVEEGS